MPTHPPPDKRSSPRSETQGHREASSLARTADETEDTPMLDFAQRLALRAPRGPRSGKRRPPSAFVSLLLPAGRRQQYWYLYKCPDCASPGLGRARALEDVTGPRRAACGHRLNIVIARLYGSPGNTR